MVFNFPKTNFLKEEEVSDALSNKYNRENFSPIFSFKNSSTIIAGSELLFDFAIDKPACEKYLPFNIVRIVNNSDEDIIIYVNQNRDRYVLIPAGLIQPLDTTIFPHIRTMIVKNNHASTSISADEIQIILSKNNATTDKLAENFHRLLSGAFKPQ